MSYGIDVSTLSRLAANDIDLILKGANQGHSIPAADQARVDHHVTVTKALGLRIPPSLLARADELVG